MRSAAHALLRRKTESARLCLLQPVGAQARVLCSDGTQGVHGGTNDTQRYSEYSAQVSFQWPDLDAFPKYKKVELTLRLCPPSATADRMRATPVCPRGAIAECGVAHE